MAIVFKPEDIDALRMFTLFNARELGGKLLKVVMESSLSDKDVEEIVSYILVADKVNSLLKNTKEITKTPF